MTLQWLSLDRAVGGEREGWTRAVSEVGSAGLGEELTMWREGVRFSGAPSQAEAH